MLLFFCLSCAAIAYLGRIYMTNFNPSLFHCWEIAQFYLVLFLFLLYYVAQLLEEKNTSINNNKRNWAFSQSSKKLGEKLVMWTRAKSAIALKCVTACLNTPWLLPRLFVKSWVDRLETKVEYLLSAQRGEGRGWLLMADTCFSALKVSPATGKTN